MEDLRDFYSDRMKKWDERKDLISPPRLTLDKLLEKVDEDHKVDRVDDEMDKEKINLLKRMAAIMGLTVEDIFK